MRSKITLIVVGRSSNGYETAIRFGVCKYFTSLHMVTSLNLSLHMRILQGNITFHFHINFWLTLQRPCRLLLGLHCDLRQLTDINLIARVCG